MRKLGCIVIVASVSGALAFRCPAATVRVPEDHKTIADAIAAAGNGDTVSVAPGEYVITKPVSFLGKPITLESRGGAADTTIRMSESPLDPHRTSVVVFESGETRASVLRGFTISGGGMGQYSSGYGVECGRFEDRPWASGPTLEGCDIRDNGNGMASRMASPRVVGCTIAGNRQAALTFYSCTSVELADCRITENPRGKLELTKSTATLTRCVVSSNEAGISGSSSTLTLKDCTIAGNSSAAPWPEPYASVGAGLSLQQGSSAELTSSTVAGNAAGGGGGGLYCSADSTVVLKTCILWDNAGGSISTPDQAKVKATACCIEGSPLWPGVGNVNTDPLFCGWGDLAEVYVDAAAGGNGDGSLARPFVDLAPALVYSLALSRDSPCVGMGAQDQEDRPAGAPARKIHLRPGTYAFPPGTLAHHASIEGAGEAETTIEGAILGLRTGATLSRLTVTRGSYLGIVVSSQESPDMAELTVSESLGAGMVFGRGSAARLADCRIEKGGGGIRSYDASPRLVRCTIAANLGCGFYCSGGAPTLDRCVISGNHGRDFEFTQETSWSGGGGFHCASSSPTLTYCTIAYNWGDYGGGVFSYDSSASLGHCTIFGNLAEEEGGGVYAAGASPPRLTSCIVWGNRLGSLAAAQGSAVDVSDSCVEGNPVWPGAGNIAADPLFCGWRETDDVYVDGAAPGPGDGTQGSPYRDLAPALAYSLELSPGSPCKGTGSGGSDMGAHDVACESQGALVRTVHLAPGTHDPRGLMFPPGACVIGAGEGVTFITGMVDGLRTGSCLQSLTVTGGDPYGIRVVGPESPRIEGCTILESSSAGVLSVGGATPTLRNCKVLCNGESSMPGSVGGGIYCRGSSPLIESCEIAENRGYEHPAGILCREGSAPSIVGTRILRNSTGLSCSGSSPLLSGCTIAENFGSGVSASEECDWDGGVQTNCVSSSPEITDCEVYANKEGISCSGKCSPRFTRCRVWGNGGDWSGAAIHCWEGTPGREGASPAFVNCEVYGNGAPSVAGALACSGRSSPTFTNCTFSGNSTDKDGRSMNCDPTSAPALINCIAWDRPGAPSCVELQHPFSLINVDPLFVRTGEFDFTRGRNVTLCWPESESRLPDFVVEAPDFRFRTGSPACDAGTSQGAPGEDIDGSPRPQGAGIDIGAHECPGCVPPTGFRRGDTDANRTVNITDAIRTLEHLFLGKDPPGCLKTADSNDDGATNITDAIYTLNYLFLGGLGIPAPHPDCGPDPSEDPLTCDAYPSCGA